MIKNYVSIALILFSSVTLASDEKTQISFFSSAKLDGWKTKIFSGETDYKIVQLEEVQVLKAESHAGASGLFKEQRIDLQKTPYLNWRWRIDNRLIGVNEKSKSGDDYSARVYVIVSGGWAFWKTKAINYVWSSGLEKGSVWANAYAGKSAMMISVRSKADKTQAWYQEKRNILNDLKEQFGSDIRYIDAVAIMTDTDNSKGNAVAYYADIFFSSQ